MVREQEQPDPDDDGQAHAPEEAEGETGDAITDHGRIIGTSGKDLEVGAIAAGPSPIALERAGRLRVLRWAMKRRSEQ